MTFASRLACLIAVLLLSPVTASAQVSTEGNGENVTHLRNISHTEIRNSRQTNQGTDMEFATITVATDTPTVVARSGAPAARSARRNAGKQARYRWVKKCRTVKRKGERVRRCKKVRVKVRRAKKTDAQPDVPGIQKTFAFAGSYYDGIDIIDVTDPTDAKRVAHYDCGIGQGDVQVFSRDGRWYLAYAQDDGYAMHDSRCVADAKALGFEPNEDAGGTYIVDVTDPYHPTTVSLVTIPSAEADPGGLMGGSHNTTVHPSGRYLYNSNADLMVSALPAIEIVDISDLRNPKVAGEFALKTFPGLGTESHDVTFNRDGTRAYVAALSHGEILDTTDPLKPVFVSAVVDPSLNVWHQAEAITLGNKQFLIGEDEFAGAEHTGQCPNGGLHVYDITNEALPVKVGYFNIDEVRPTDPTSSTSRGRCTAHVFQIDHEQKLMTMGWYNAGVRILDLSALEGIGIADQGMGIKQVGFFQFKDTDAWTAKAPAGTMNRNGFHFYANDKRRGFDVYRYTPGATKHPGIWLTPAEALARNRRLRAQGPANLSGVCFLAGR